MGRENSFKVVRGEKVKGRGGKTVLRCWEGKKFRGGEGKQFKSGRRRKSLGLVREKL